MKSFIIKSGLQVEKAIVLLKFFAPLLIVFSCTEPIDLELDTTFKRLVVEGSFTSDSTIHRLKLSTTADFYDNRPPPPVSDAIITITDGARTHLLIETPAGSGIYETKARVRGVVGRTYTLRIELPREIGGHKSYTASCLLKPTPVPDLIKLAHHGPSGQGIWEIRLYAQDPPTNDFYMFMVYKNRELMTDSLYKLFVMDDRLFNGNYAYGIGVAYLNERNERERLKPKDTVMLMSANITEEYAKFLWAIRSEQFNTPIFGGPPANVPGNVSNGAIGFFAVYQPRYISTIYKGI